MLHNYTYTERTDFYVIKMDLETIKLSDLKDYVEDGKTLTILKKYVRTTHWIYDGREKTDWNGHISIINSDGELANDLTSNDWHFNIHSMASGYGYYKSTQGFKAKFIDSFENEISTEIFYQSVQGFLSAYERFLKLSAHKGYKVAVVELEKEQLTLENNNLKQEIVDLKAEIAKLRDRIAHFG